MKFWNKIWLRSDDEIGEMLMFLLKWSVLVCLIILTISGTVKAMQLLF
ncbi:hypothetical protein J2W97_001317 [Paenibacillus jamilae]|nr:hypothetical protein [Paenibacillus jamilae]